MSLLAHLQFGDNSIGQYTKEYLVTQCQYQFSRQHNYRLPDTDARCATIEVSIVAPGKEDLGLYEWYIDKMVLSGRILFNMSNFSSNEDSPQKELYFEDAHCFSLSEEYHINGTFQRLIKLAFIAEQITIDSVSFTNVK